MGLCLSRKEKESVDIAQGLITVTVVSIQGNRVDLRFDAPRDIPIIRGELIRAEKIDDIVQRYKLQFLDALQLENALRDIPGVTYSEVSKAYESATGTPYDSTDVRQARSDRTRAG